MSFAPSDSHEAQVQFALERGVPAMIGIIATNRIPYPARAFDMARCSRCLIPWNKYGKPFLVVAKKIEYIEGLQFQSSLLNFNILKQNY
jgi:Putative S-adenosyl-L-methionine-dependent methyltransferase